MSNKMLDFLKIYIQGVEQKIQKVGIYKTVSQGLNLLIFENILTQDELRKSLSVFIKRIISEYEFDNLLNPDAIEYQRIMYE